MLTSILGDFHYNSSTKQSTDYNYDGDGNLIQDNNKAITSISYNYLNLPQLIHFQSKGNISYIYDASGEKLAKITIDSVAQHSVRTLYLDGMVYQQTGTIASSGGKTDTLQFINHEEGRVRWAYHIYTSDSLCLCLRLILLDDQFNYVSTASGSIAVASTTYPANQFNTIAAGGPIVMPRNGYLYVWVSNETQGWDVFFDNFTVQYKQGPVLEENHYYPYGLTMSGISDKAEKTQYAQNKYRYTGKDLQNQEFSDGSGLEEYDYGARMQDPQLGVWHGIDPLTNLNRRWSPYNYGKDNPVRFIDPDGMDASASNSNSGDDGDEMVHYHRTLDGNGNVSTVIDGSADPGESESYTDLSDGEYGSGVTNYDKGGSDGGQSEDDKRNYQNLNSDKGDRNYTTIHQRADCYKWVAIQLKSKGFRSNGLPLLRK